LDPLRERLRRLQLVVGMGFLAFVVGAVLSSALVIRLQPRLEALGSPWVAFGLTLLIKRLWVVAVLPVCCYGAARILELRPWATALGAALTGEAFLLALRLVSTGLDGFADPGLDEGFQLATLVGGVALSRWAVVKGRAAAAKANAAAASAAAAKKAQYDEFAAEAERLATRRDEKPIAPATPATAEAAVGKAPAVPDAKPIATAAAEAVDAKPPAVPDAKI
jgi:hypothetical protein